VGADVTMKARPFGPMTADEFDDLRSRFIEVMPVEFELEDVRYPDLRWNEYEPVPTIEVATCRRYYSPGYERGHWPDIKAMGDWLALNLGERAELRYGSDYSYEWEYLSSPWADARTENDLWWEQFENRPYREFRLGQLRP
jgi:hypothetical protein